MLRLSLGVELAPRAALDEILARLKTWKKEKPVGGSEAQDIAAFDRQVQIVEDQLKWYA
jgi:hypothetical protein